MASDEQIMVIKRELFEELGNFHGLQFDVERYMKKIFEAGAPRFMLRSKAENDPSYKQLIPYVIMNHGDKYLNYVRGKRAGEKRLVGNISIGIGGHINPVDDVSLLGHYQSYLQAVDREVAEEVNVETKYQDRIVALLNDETNEVGQVHLGIVHLRVLEEPAVTRREQMITQMSFMTKAELEKVSESMETWSSLCLGGLDKMKAAAGF
jgi:predicted NUDIX family phosphoesterase